MFYIAWPDQHALFLLAANLSGPLILWWLVFRRLPMLLKIYEIAYRRGRKDSAELLMEMGLQIEAMSDEEDGDNAGR